MCVDNSCPPIVDMLGLGPGCLAIYFTYFVASIILILWPTTSTISVVSAAKTPTMAVGSAAMT